MKSHKFCGLGLCRHINTARLYRYYFVSDIETFNVALDRVGTCTEPDKARVF